jgi:hypothetical protein
LKLKRNFRFAWKRKKSLISHDSLPCETPKIRSEKEGKYKQKLSEKIEAKQKVSEKK